MRTLLILLLSIGLVSAEEARGVEAFVSMMTGQGWKLEEGSGCKRGERGVEMLVFTRGNDEWLDAAVTESSVIRVRQYYRGELVAENSY
jgi:hypothetical protein